MRTLTNLWADRKPFTRRVRWYQGINPDDVRLEFIDPHRKLNVCLTSRETAQRLYDEFKAGRSAEDIYNDYKTLRRTP